MSREKIIAHVKQTFVNSTFTAASGVALDFGTFACDAFSKLTGIFSVVGSFNFRMQFGPSSGTYFVASSTVINSGGATLDVPAYGKFANLGFTGVVSSQPGVYIAGEAIR